MGAARKLRTIKTYPELRKIRGDGHKTKFNYPILIFAALFIFSLAITFKNEPKQSKKETLKEFVEKVLKDSTGKKERYIIGKIPNEIIKEVGILAGKSIKGFTYSITADDVRHIQKKHGEGKEKQKDQRGIKPKDYKYLIKTLYAPDMIRQSEILKSGAHTVKFKKDKYTLLIAISNRKKTLTVLTFYIKSKPR